MGSSLVNDNRIEQYLENTNIVVSSSALPTGASTAALQTTGNGLLTDIKTNQTNATQIALANLRGYRSSDASYQPLRLDKATNSIQTIEYEHHEIHGGSSYTASRVADIGNGANMDVLVITPDTTAWAHFVYEIDVESESHFYIYEAPTITDNGTAITTYNRDRNSGNTSGLTVFHTPTVGATGTTVIREWHIGSGRSVGGGDRATQEFILKQNTKYLIRINNQTTNNNYMALKLSWYEHTNIA